MSTNVDRSEVAALARAFARHLEHLRMFRGVHYVGAGAIPVGEESVFADPVADAEPSPPSQSPKIVEPVQREAPPSEPARPSAEQWSAAKKLQYLRERNVGDCHRCPLAATRRNIVFGVGNPDADLMFVGEAPGAEEDRLGEPFVGAAGQRLDQWITHLGLRRDQVYIANVLKCRPPGNRDPQPLEIERCSPFLHAQIRAIEPKVIVALGRFAGCLLLDRDLKLYEMRGAVHRYREPKSGTEIPLVVTYHPSYVIRREQEPGAQAKPDRGAPIKSEDAKVRADLERARSLM
jgi:uracil-DNA glycosylase family 4